MIYWGWGMASGKAAEVQAAARALFEGAPADLELISQLSGKTVAHFARIAKRDGWRSREIGPDSLAALENRLAALATGMVDEMERLGFSALSGQYDKQRIDALSALLKIVERLDEFVRGSWHSGHSAEKEKKDDAELATALALVDARIVELACELAAAMGGKPSLAGDGGANTA